MAELFNKKPDLYLETDLFDTPSDANFWISGRCNFACRYCLHGAAPDDPARQKLKRDMLSFERFVKMADDLGRFPGNVRSASFCGIGEPTLHPELPDMIDYLKKNRLVRAVEVTTNGSLLDRDLSERLIRAGVDYLTVSIQGISTDDYKRVCGNPIDPEKIAEEVKWFKEHSFGASIHVKTLDYALKDKTAEELFVKMFENCCDHITIAHAIKMHQGMDYSGVVDTEVDQFTGGEVRYAGFCPLVFSSIHLFPNGDISVCPLPEGPLLLGNIDDTSLVDAWNKKERLELLLRHAKMERQEIPVCASCREPDMMVGNSFVREGVIDKIKKL